MTCGPDPGAEPAQAASASAGSDSGRVRTDIPPWLQDRDPAVVIAERAAELRGRVEGFVGAVRR